MGFTNPVDQQLIFLPLFAQVLLTALIWCWMYYTRIREIRRANIEVQALAQAPHAQELLGRVSTPAENLINLFEIPVLFYVAVIVLYVTGTVSTLYLTLMSAFVALRYAHSLIHITYNRVIHRFLVYATSTTILWIIWALIATELIAR